MLFCHFCGNTVTDNTEYCANCGHSIEHAKSKTADEIPDRFPIERAEMKDDKQIEGKRGLRWGLICLGAFSILAVGFVGFGAAVLLTIPLWADSGDDQLLTVLDIGIALICLLFGGLIIGRKARYRSALHGMLSTLIVGVTIIVLSAIGTWKEGVSTESYIFLMIGLFSPGLGALGGFLGERLNSRRI
jgi:putative membrane protein (TIGR04086 family)